MARSPSGKATVCKTVIEGSIPSRASFIGAHVAPSTGKAGSSLPLNAALRLIDGE